MKKIAEVGFCFQCDFCTDKFDDEFICSEHESKCFFNPKMRSCNTCDNGDAITSKGWNGIIWTWYICKKGLLTEVPKFKMDCEGWVSKEKA